jgi:hypothetical protein
VLTWKPGWLRGYIMRSDGRSTQPPTDRRELRAYEAFLEQARWAAEWQWRRSESYERKAGALAAFVTFVLTAQIATVRSIISVPRTPFSWAIIVFLAVSTCALAIAALLSIRALTPRDYQAASIGQLRKEWEEYNVSGHLSGMESVSGHLPDAGLAGLFAEQLIRGTEEKSPIQSLHDDAEKRGKDFGKATCALCVSIAMMALVLLIALLQAATQKEYTDGRAGEGGTATVTTRTGAGAATSTIPARGKSGRD